MPSLPSLPLLSQQTTIKINDTNNQNTFNQTMSCLPPPPPAPPCFKMTNLFPSLPTQQQPTQPPTTLSIPTTESTNHTVQLIPPPKHRSNLSTVMPTITTTITTTNTKNNNFNSNNYNITNINQQPSNNVSMQHFTNLNKNKNMLRIEKCESESLSPLKSECNNINNSRNQSETQSPCHNNNNHTKDIWQNVDHICDGLNNNYHCQNKVNDNKLILEQCNKNNNNDNDNDNVNANGNANKSNNHSLKGENNKNNDNSGGNVCFKNVQIIPPPPTFKNMHNMHITDFHTVL